MTAHARQPEYEISTNRHIGSVRYLEHGAQSARIRWHCHPEYELHFIAAGTGQVFIGDYIGPFQPGQLVLTGPQVPHNWVSTPNWPSESGVNSAQVRDQVIHFDHDLIEQMRHTMPELRSLDPLLERSSMGLLFSDFPYQQAAKFLQGIRNRQGLGRLSVFFELLETLSQWPRWRTLSTARYSEEHDRKVLNQIDQAVALISKHYSEPLRLADVAQSVGMSESHFSRLFKQITGMRFVEFINRLRVHHVCELLLETDLHITTICYQVGFNNIANFNRHFQALKQITPREYRIQARSQFIGPKRPSPSLLESEFF